MTFNDYAVECSLYEYSNEHFELMKECSEIALGERWIKNQLILTESAEDLGISEDATITESFLMESADENSLQAMYEKTEAKKAGVWSKFIAWIKRGLSIVGKWFLRLAGDNYDDIVAQLKAQVGKNERLEYELGELQKSLDKAGVHIKTANSRISDLENKVKNQEKEIKDKDEKIKGRDERIGKMVHQSLEDSETIRKQKKTISDLKKSGEEKDAEIKRQQDQNTELGKEVTKWSEIAEKYKGLLALADTKNRKLQLVVDNLSCACSPTILCDVMTEMGKLIKKGYESHGTMIKPNAVRQITKKLDDAIDEQRAGNMVIDISTNEFKNCGNEMSKLLDGLNAMQSSTESSFDAEAAKLISEAMVKINKAQADTMKMVKPLINTRNRLYGLGKSHGKQEAKKEAKKEAEGK